MSNSNTLQEIPWARQNVLAQLKHVFIITIFHYTRMITRYENRHGKNALTQPRQQLTHTHHPSMCQE